MKNEDLTPSVIAIVVSWNGREDTLKCLESIRQSDYPRLEVILVDNASTDGTPEAVKEHYPETIVIRNSENLLFSKGVNIGISCAVEMGGDYFFLLNNDATIAPGCISNLVRAMEAEPGCGLSGPKIFYSGTSRIWSAGGRVRLWAGTTSHIGIRKQDSQAYSKVSQVDYLTACALMIRRQVVEKVGVLDDRYFIYGEDADFSLRAGKAGYKILFVPEALAWHRISASSGGGLTPFKVYNRAKSGVFLLKRHGKWHHYLTAPLFGFLGVVLFSVKSLVTGDLKNILPLWKGVLSGISAAYGGGTGQGQPPNENFWWSPNYRVRLL